jgi:arylsulfatase A-like enzyme
MGSQTYRTLFGLAVLAGLCSACAKNMPEVTPPNILLVVWDTARLDRLGIYGAERATTPFLDAFAKRGLVFDDFRSVAPSTVPSHGSMFTGLFPRDHGANHESLWLASEHETLAEILTGAGYDTYSFSANPNITEMENFNQGFETEEHLWDEVWRSAAIEDLAAHYQFGSEGRPLDNNTGLAKRLRDGQLLDQEIKGCGALLMRGLGKWLDREERDSERPWFGFLNYMEAHYPLQPAQEFRQRLMGDEQLRQSYLVDRSWPKIWNHVFGFEQLSPKALESLDVTYDAAIAELDFLFENLIADLEKRGELDNTVVILTSDHGEHLGEHGMLDHRYSLSEELLRVPFVIWGSEKLYPVTPGRSDFPAMNIDVFPTILSAADEKPVGEQVAIDLLGTGVVAGEKRVRFAEFPNDFEIPRDVRTVAPDGWSGKSFARRLISVVADDFKLVVSESPSEALRLYNLATDPECDLDLYSLQSSIALDLQALCELYASREIYDPVERGGRSEVERDRLGAIGYGE